MMEVVAPTSTSCTRSPRNDSTQAALHNGFSTLKTMHLRLKGSLQGMPFPKNSARLPTLDVMILGTPAQTMTSRLRARNEQGPAGLKSTFKMLSEQYPLDSVSAGLN